MPIKQRNSLREGWAQTLLLARGTADIFPVRIKQVFRLRVVGRFYTGGYRRAAMRPGSAPWVPVGHGACALH